MNKFIIAEMPKEDEINQNNPVLYRIHIGTRYYLHKGKILKDSVNKLLDDIFRGIRGKIYDERYSLLVEYCAKYPAIHKVVVELISNDVPAKILKLESSMYKTMKTDELALNRLDIAPYKPEWMIKQSLQARCNECIGKGIINGKSAKFKFCPNCGRINK
jgi:hypothetical protein